MAQYTALQPAAFIHNPDSGPLHRQFYTVSFPVEWREAVLDLYARSLPERRREVALTRRRVPIRRLDRLMRAVAPELVAVGADATIDADTPWLYANEPYPPAVMRGFLSAWLHDMYDKEHDGQSGPDAETYRRIREATRILDTSCPPWTLTGVDLLSQELSAGGTAVPDRQMYRLLPEYLADRIADFSQHTPYEHGGGRLNFRRAAGLVGSEAELISWPPNRFRKNDRISYYSAYIRLSLRTVPFSPISRIHMSTGVHRWVSGKVNMRGLRAASVYILANSSLVPDGPVPERFAVADIAWRHRTRQVEWRDGGPGGMLVRVSMLDGLPPADVLEKDAAEWIHGRDGLSLAVTYHTTMGRHDVASGLMPEERRRLVTWAAQALAPEFMLVAPMKRSSISKRNPIPSLGNPKSVTNKATDEDKRRIEEENRRIAAQNGDLRRVRTAAALEGDDSRKKTLSAVLFYQNEVMRSHLIHAIEKHLNLTSRRQETGPDVWSWSTRELDVYLRTAELRELGGPLGSENTPRTRKEMEEAVAQRRAAVAKKLREIIGMCDEASTPVLVFVELEGRFRPSTRTGFHPKADPKGAIRLGCADAGMVSQFFRPIDLEMKEEKRDQDAAYRTEAAWADGLRQLGIRLTPQHSLGDDVPTDLAQVAFWIVKRQVDSTSNNRQFTPVALHVRGNGPVLGRTPDLDEWIPYRELLMKLTGQVNTPTTVQMQKEITAAFVKKTLYAMRGTDTLVITHAQNSRSRWPWLLNPGLIEDRLALGDGPAQRLRIHGKRLRIARVATHERGETPQWWAIPEKETKSAGLSKGLWLPGDLDPSGRVFYASAERPQTMRAPTETTKLTPHTIKKPAEDEDEDSTVRDMHNPAAQMGTPQLIELTMAGLCEGDDPEVWAMFLQQQRNTEDSKTELALPFLLHMAALTKEYALPYEEIVDDTDEPATEAAEQEDAPMQLELELDLEE